MEIELFLEYRKIFKNCKFLIEHKLASIRNKFKKEKNHDFFSKLMIIVKYFFKTD